MLNQITEIQRRKKKNLLDLTLVVPRFSDIGTKRKINPTVKSTQTDNAKMWEGAPLFLPGVN